jgi:glutamine amidotransferase
MLFLQILFFGGKHREDAPAGHGFDLAQILAADEETTTASEGETKRFTADEMRRAMTKTVRLIAKWTSKKLTRADRERSGYSLLNYAVSDGVSVVVTRYTDDPIGPPASLYYTSGTRYQAKKKGEYHLVQERRQECFIIASEPLSVSEDDRRDWVPVPKNHCVVVTSQHNLLLYPIDVALADVSHHDPLLSHNNQQSYVDM